jgi:hypothetical protein
MDVDATIGAPLQAVQATFSKGNATWEADVERGFSELFASPEALARIPSLNDTRVEMLKPGSLVRYRCMVQDVQDPEYYMGAYQQAGAAAGEAFTATAKYRDAIPMQGSPMEDAAPMERLPLHCVPIPGEAAWANQAHAAAGIAAAQPGAGRVVSSGTKRGAEDPSLEEGAHPAAAAAAATTMAKKPPPAAAGPGVGATAAPMAAASQATPAAATAYKVDNACLVKVYHEDGANIRVHDTYEFVGVLSVEPGLATFGTDPTASCQPYWPADGIEATVPHSALPRLHAIFSRAVNPCLEPCFADGADLDAAAAAMSPTMHGTALSLREGFVSAATAALGGDRLAAEYLLLHCISGIYQRVENLCLGQMALNLSDVPPAPAPMQVRLAPPPRREPAT